MDDSTSVPVETSTSAPPPSGQAAQTSPASTPTPQVQSETVQPAGSPIPSGYVKEEDFKGLQRQLSQTLTNTQRQYQQQIAQYQQQLAEAQMAGMDDLEKERFQRQQLEAQLQQRLQYDEMTYLQQQRWNKLNEIATKTGVPVDTLVNAQTPDEAYDIALSLQKQQIETLATKRAAEIKELQEHSKVDLGSGSYTNPKEQRIADAIKRKDTNSYYNTVLSGTD